MNYSKAIALISTMALGACASIIEGGTDRVEFKTAQDIPAQCEATNGRGTYNFSVPGTAEIQKSKTDLVLNCTGSGGATGKKDVASDMETWTLGNVLIGGLIGLGIDAGTGSMWEYPKDVSINMNIPTPPAPEPTAAIDDPQAAPVALEASPQEAPVATQVAPEANIEQPMLAPAALEAQQPVAAEAPIAPEAAVAPSAEAPAVQ